MGSMQYDSAHGHELEPGIYLNLQSYVYHFMHLYFNTGLSILTTITISSFPAHVIVNNNTIYHPVLSSVTFGCVVDPLTPNTIDYQWNTTGCYTNINYNDGVPSCFPHNQTTQNVTDNDLTAEDAGKITCGIMVNGELYTSDPITLHVTGMSIE